jgi:hypothetical protein
LQVKVFLCPLRKHRDEMCHWENIVTKCVTERTSWRNVSLRKHRDEMCHWENIVTKCVTEKTSWRNVSLRKHRDEMCHWENIVTKCVTAKTSWRNVWLRKTFEFFLNFNCYVSVWGSLNNDSPDFLNSLKIESDTFRHDVFSVTHFVTMLSQWHISSRCFLSDTFRHDVFSVTHFVTMFSQWHISSRCSLESKIYMVVWYPFSTGSVFFFSFKKSGESLFKEPQTET